MAIGINSSYNEDREEENINFLSHSDDYLFEKEFNSNNTNRGYSEISKKINKDENGNFSFETSNYYFESDKGFMFITNKQTNSKGFYTLIQSEHAFITSIMEFSENIIL